MVSPSTFFQGVSPSAQLKFAKTILPGEVYRLRMPGMTVVFVSTQALVNEVCDETRFQKSLNNVLRVRKTKSPSDSKQG